MADRFKTINAEDENLCFLCLEPSNSFCSRCSLPYCTEAHLRVHFKAETNYCFPFRVLQRPQVGRYLVATRDLEPLELILEDEPAILGPSHDTIPICLECLSPVNGDFLCPHCDLPLCGPNCANGPNHRPECQVFSKPLETGFKFKVHFNTGYKYAPEYCCIAPLRALELKKNDPEAWARLSLLMDHDAERKTEMQFYDIFKANVIDFLIKVCGLDYDEDEIFKILGIIRTNALKVNCPQKVKGVTGRVVYPTLSYISHSCLCNARYHSMTPDTQSIVVRSQREIKKGEEICITYVSFVYGNLRRKKQFRSYWFFDCQCPRCQDPTEMGSYLSAIKCSKQDCNGYLLPENAMDLESKWQCSECQVQESVPFIQEVVSSCFDLLYNIGSSPSIAQYETVLRQCQEKLHPQHNIIMTVKKFLADSYELEDVGKLPLKVQYYKEFMDVMSRVDPGFPVWRGQVLFEMHKPMLLMANKAYDCGEMDKEDFIKALNEVVKNLEISIKCLQHEPTGSKEAFQASSAIKALKDVKEALFFSDYL